MMTTQQLARKRPRIGKLMLMGAIATSSVAIVFLLVGFHWAPLTTWYVFVIFVILYLPLSWMAAILYLIREEQAVAARAWGILGGFALALFPLVFMFCPWIGIPSWIALIMAIGGAVLPLRKPKLAGILMLAGAIGSGATSLFLFGLIVVMLCGVYGEGADLLILLMLVPPLLSISFLIPGGILSLTSQKNQPASRKMVIGTIGALFALPVLASGFVYLLVYLLWYHW